MTDSVFVWPFLLEAVGGALPRRLAAAIRILPCDHDEDGRFVRFAGLDRARTILWKARRDGAALPGLLILGMFPPPTASAAGPASMAVLAWPGARYLEYGFDRKTLAAAAREAANGCARRLPDGLLPTATDIRRSVAEARHWLENRLCSAEGARGSFEAALSGAALHPGHFDPVPAVSAAHRDMLEGLWAMETPGTGEFAQFMAAIAAFEDRWRTLEACRADLRAVGDARCRALLEPACDALCDAGKALSAAIEAAGALEIRLAERDA